MVWGNDDDDNDDDDDDDELQLAIHNEFYH